MPAKHLSDLDPTEHKAVAGAPISGNGKSQAEPPAHRKEPGVTLAHGLAGRIENMVAQGALPPGSKLPSVRQAKAKFGVSVGTAVEAYRLLEHRGVIQAKPQSGFYVRHAPIRRGPTPKATKPSLKVHSDPSRLADQMIGHAFEADMVGLGAAMPDVGLMPTEALTRQMAKQLRDANSHAFAYAPIQGAKPLREQIALCMVQAECAIDPNDIVVTAGCSEALQLCLTAATQPGDVVAVESPCYYGLLDLLGSLGLKALPIATDTDKGLSVAALERALVARQVKALAVIPNFSNPTGATLPVESRRGIAELARQHDLWVLEDDIYGELGHGGQRLPAIQSHDTDGRVLYCSSFSKTLAPGFRMGWCVPGKLLQQVKQLKRTLTFGTALPPQLAIAGYLAQGGFRRHLSRLQRTYAERMHAMAQQVLTSFPKGTCVSQPHGGSILWVQMPDACDAIRLFEDCEARGIAIAPGPIFSPDGSLPNCLRLNASKPWTPALADAVCTVGRLAQEQLVPHTGRKTARRVRRRSADATN